MESRNQRNVSSQIKVLRQMGAAQLRNKYLEVFGEPTRPNLPEYDPVHGSWLGCLALANSLSIELEHLRNHLRRTAGAGDQLGVMEELLGLSADSEGLRASALAELLAEVPMTEVVARLKDRPRVLINPAARTVRYTESAGETRGTAREVEGPLTVEDGPPSSEHDVPL